MTQLILRLTDFHNCLIKQYKMHPPYYISAYCEYSLYLIDEEKKIHIPSNTALEAHRFAYTTNTRTKNVIFFPSSYVRETVHHPYPVKNDIRQKYARIASQPPSLLPPIFFFLITFKYDATIIN